jgi:hypothetical protein
MLQRRLAIEVFRIFWGSGFNNQVYLVYIPGTKYRLKDSIG